MFKNQLTFLFIAFILFACSNQPETARITGTIHTEVPVDSIYLGLYDMKRGTDEYVGEPITFLSQTDTSFSMNLKPGKYTLAVYGYGVEKYEESFIILDARDKLHFAINLPAHGYDAVFDTIYVLGEYCDWTTPNAAILENEGDVFVLKNSEVIKKGDGYKFWTKKPQILYDLRLTTREVVKNYAAFNNIADGEPIIFDPKLYKSEVKSGWADVEGFELSVKYNQLNTALKEFSQNKLYPFLRQRRTLAPDEWQTQYAAIKFSLDSLSSAYPEFRQQILITELVDLRYAHPVNYELIQLYKSDADSAQFARFYTSKDYVEYVKYHHHLIQQLDPQSIFFEAHLAGGILGFDYAFSQAPALADETGISADYFEKFVLDFAEKALDPERKGNLIFELGRHFSYADQPEKAEKYLKRVQTEFPDNWYVTRGVVERQLNGLKVRKGTPAPGFAVQSLDGDSLRLADFKGKFVFIDFWGSWCGPCLGELPNFRKLAQTISANELQIIGLARDDEKSLRAYLAQEPLPYPNALAPEEVLKVWGINAYPTTFLIDPNGIILAKNLRGERIIEKVREEMDKFLKRG